MSKSSNQRPLFDIEKKNDTDTTFLENVDITKRESGLWDDDELTEDDKINGVSYKQLRNMMLHDVMTEVEKKINNWENTIKHINSNEEICSDNGDIYNHLPRNNEGMKIEPDKEYKIVNCLADIINSRGLKQSRIANQLGISEKTLSNIINGRFNTSLETTLKLCYLLDLKVDDVFWLVETQKEK